MKAQSQHNRIRSGLVFALLLTLGTQWSTLALAAPISLSSPDKDVETITQGLLKAFQENLDKYKQNSEAFVVEVDRQLSPVVAFHSIARGVMGRYSRSAKPAQVEQFARVFKSSLISFYGKALLKLDNVSLVIDKIDPVSGNTLRDYEQGKIRQIPVNMQVRTSKRTVAISYSMVHIDGRWKLRNIIVDGINIGKQFRNQFADAMGKHRDIQFVVDHWLDIMRGKDVAVAGKTSS